MEQPVAETSDPIDVTSESLVLDYADDGGVRQWALTNYNDPKSSQDVWVPVHPAINAALNAAGFRVVPIVDDATLQEVEDMVLGTLPSRCPATLGKRPTWMGVDQYDPCSCRLPNGHDGDHECAHGAEPNMHPGEPKRLLPTVTGRPAELLAAAYLGRND